jgi:hypothetical protein
MSIFWRWIVSCLVWLSADHDRLATEPGRAAAAVSAARASILEEMESPPSPKPKPQPVKSGTCTSGTCTRPGG